MNDPLAWYRSAVPYDSGGVDEVRWGDEVTLTVVDAGVTGDLVRIPLLPRAVLCRVNFHGEVLSTPAAASVTQLLPFVNRTILDLQVGCGSQTTTMRHVFRALPQLGQNTGVMGAEFGNVTLDREWYVPLARINGRVTVFGPQTAPGLIVRYSLWVTPVAEVANAGA